MPKPLHWLRGLNKAYTLRLTEAVSHDRESTNCRSQVELSVTSGQNPSLGIASIRLQFTEAFTLMKKCACGTRKEGHCVLEDLGDARGLFSAIRWNAKRRAPSFARTAHLVLVDEGPCSESSWRAAIAVFVFGAKVVKCFEECATDCGAALEELLAPRSAPFA